MPRQRHSGPSKAVLTKALEKLFRSRLPSIKCFQYESNHDKIGTIARRCPTALSHAKVEFWHLSTDVCFSAG